MSRFSITIELQVSNRLLDLQQQRIDFAFRQGPLSDSNLIAKKLFTVHYGLYATPDFLSAHPPIKSLSDLESVAAIGINAQGYNLAWPLQQDGKTIKYQPKPVCSMEDQDLMLAATLASIGIGYLPTLKAQQAIKKKRLSPVLGNHWPDPVGFYLVYQNKAYQPEKDRLFLKFITHQSLTKHND